MESREREAVSEEVVCHMAVMARQVEVAKKAGSATKEQLREAIKIVDAALGALLRETDAPAQAYDELRSLREIHSDPTLYWRERVAIAAGYLEGAPSRKKLARAWNISEERVGNIRTRGQRIARYRLMCESRRRGEP